ncbi:MAG: hypothetical protein WC372_03985 [Candidatus Neomarinimicrobiota bacterium]|jgi:hypothetical protein
MKLQPFGIPPAPDIDTTEIAVPYTKTGAGKHYFSTTDNIGSLTSVNMDTLLINNRVFSNQTVTDLPEKEEGYYYIYYSASLSTAAMMIEFPAEPEPEVPEFIHYNGNDYTVKMMPYSYRGNTEYYIAVSGTISSYSSNALNIFEINGVNMNNASGLPDPEDGKKYFIHFKGARGNSTINIDGINDWSTLEDPAPIDTVTIDLPFTVNGAGEYYYSTTNALDSLSSSSVDELLVNRVDLSNQNTSNIPPAINGVYYIYYRSSLPSATASFYLPKPVEKDTLEVGIPYRASGSGKYYFSTGEDLYSVSSENMDTLLINDQDYTNLTITSLPPDINGKYYIYYSASQQTANMSLGAAPPDTVSIHLPFTKTGSGEQYYVTAEEIGEISSSGMLALDINGIDFKNRTSNDLPEKINGNYYIYYHAVNSDAAMTLQKTPENPEIINWNGNDYSFIEMPWSYIGSSVTRVYTYGKITSFNTNNFITSLEINGQSYTVNQTHTDPPASIDQKYFITITPKNHKGEFEIDGETKKFVYKLNIKVLLEGAL